MLEDKYQIKIKAQYINLLLLKDELLHFDKELSKSISDAEGWVLKLRTIRGVFLTLNNVKDIADRLQIDSANEFVNRTRILRKNLIFANHFRNRGIGHLDDTLLERTAQWSPQIFHEATKHDESYKIIEAQRTIIESCINSFINKDGVQKVFDTEIDLMYPPNAEQFLSYLSELVKEALTWLSEAADGLLNNIKHHTDEDIRELAAVAGQTSFNLKENIEPEYSPEKFEIGLNKAIKELERQGTDTKVIDLIRNLMLR